MESFCSLFDPSDGITTKRLKDQNPKGDPPKGRRRRRNQNKHDTLPEESSFLCDPGLTNDILVKDGSYIDTHIAPINEDSNAKRRNSFKKNRRKKYKNNIEDEKLLEWNNKTSCVSKVDDNVGKNVNDLNKFDVNRRKDWGFDEDAINVIEKLETVNMKDDVFLAGEFNADDLENDPFYSSDDLEDFDDSQSDLEDSADEVYGSLPPEPRFGNVEYKLQLVNPCERRFQHLVTQLAWRLRSGGGGAVYVLGVRDCGSLAGLRPRALRHSLHTLRRMVTALRATILHVAARRVAANRAVAEVYIRKLADTQQNTELRVAVMGANEAGKSTLIGVLTQGELDNGRGSARLNMFRHLHEVKSGNTSSLSHEILGFDSQGNVVNYGCSELMTAERIGERSSKLVWFLDLAGHHKYQRTTIHGLTGYSPHYAMLLISATGGINRMTEEHIGLLLALDMTFFIVVTKIDLAQNNLDGLMENLTKILEKGTKKKRPVLITDENAARNCVAPQKLILDSLDSNGNDEPEDDDVETVFVFPVSCVRGWGLRALHHTLLTLEPTTTRHATELESCEFQIDEIFHKGDTAGPVVGGLLARGKLREGDNLLIGPLDTGEFEEIAVRTIYRNRVNCGLVKAGQSASLGLSRLVNGLRQGMVLVAKPEEYKSLNYIKPMFGECSGNCKLKPALRKDIKNKKQRKHKNVVEDKEICEDITSKGNSIPPQYCSCSDVILLEDPNDPRGCLFFQATVHLLRHSTAIYPGFQATVHVGNVRQTAVIEGIMSRDKLLRAGESASVVFRFVRQPEYLRRGRKMLFRDGLETHGVGRITQLFPYI